MTRQRPLLVKFSWSATRTIGTCTCSCVLVCIFALRGASAFALIRQQQHQQQQQQQQRPICTAAILDSPISNKLSCGIPAWMVATDDNIMSSSSSSDASSSNTSHYTNYNNSGAAVDIPGKEIAATIRQEIQRQVEKLQGPPGLAVILVGRRRDSQTYVNMKTKACAQVGIVSHQVNFDEETAVTQQQVMDTILKFNADPAIHGILIQLPLPDHLDRDAILKAVDPNKDVDGLHPVNIAKLATIITTPYLNGHNLLPETSQFPIPCTPLGCMELLVRSGVEIAGKHAVVIGRSQLVGLPMSRLLLAADATVTVVHSKTRNIEQVVRQGDIVVAAVGKPGMVKKEWLKPGAVVIDVGINSVDNDNIITPNNNNKPGAKPYKLVGDVDYANAKQVCSLITPVPGGVGPMTIAMLLRNTVDACQRAQSQSPSQSQ
jgi:methylenetetrahydrofolate dehydrogenase (NADP+) / methenyltetrahydrofolate cyclohydrolase